MPTLPTHAKTNINPEFDEDPFSDNGLLCPFCKTAHGVTIARSQCGTGFYGLDVVTGFDCSNCDNFFYVAIFRSKYNAVHFEFVQPIPEPKSEPEPEPEPIKRKPIKPSLRFEILKRDNYRCQMCGVTAKDGAALEIDHITPVAKGGGNDADNLQVLCRDCNVGKSDQYQ